MGRLSSGDDADENGGVARARGGKVVIYERRGVVGPEVWLDGDTLWLTLAQIAELFGRDKSVVSRHLTKVFKSRELSRRATVAEIAAVQREGGRDVVRRVEYYNLDAILSVGYRVNSKEGTRFLIWATRTLREHVLRGFTLNERRLPCRGAADTPISRSEEAGSGRLLLRQSQPNRGRDPLRSEAALWQGPRSRAPRGTTPGAV